MSDEINFQLFILEQKVILNH